MYHISVPISYPTVTPESMPRYAQLLAQLGATRVFLCLVGEVYRKDSAVFTEPERIRQVIADFRSLGMEVGIWVNAFGHGALLAHQNENEVGDYTRITDCHGDSAPVAYCPLDQRFRADYCEGIRQVALLKPDLIMLDDDLRFNMRKNFFTIGCFCPQHLQWYYRLLGEQLPPEEIEQRIFTGAPNRYRKAYFDMMGATLLQLAKQLRSVVDGVDPTIRLGASVAGSMWDCSGTDVLTLAKAFAGSTRPFSRIAGAPYHNVNILPTIERTRLQCAWGKDSGVELFCEGDTYPRPRYNVPARTLELFDFAMACDGTSHGMLQYLFDYTHSLSYEEGYARRMIRNRPVREQAAALFAGKRAEGVEVYDVMGKLAHWVLPETLGEQTVQWIQATPSKGLAELLQRNSIPTAYEQTDLPVLVLGESARHIPLEKLRHGAIVDAGAAELLQQRGVDVGLLGLCEAGTDEYFIATGETVRGIGRGGKTGMRTAGEAETMYGDAVASYRYENAAGQRFFVLGCRFHTPGCFMNANYLCSWARRQQLQQVIPWLCGRKLPVTLHDAPETALLVRRDEKSMAVALINCWYDELIDPVIELDQPYTRLRCVNCAGRVDGDRVTLETIPPYGFAAFEVAL